MFDVDHQLLRDSELGYYVDAPKTKNGVRQIPMSEKVYQALKRAVKNRGKAAPVNIGGYTNFLFLNQSGLPKTAFCYESMFQGLVRKYNKHHKPDEAVLKIQINRQAAQLGDAEAGPQQDDDLIAILPVDRVAASEGQETVLLFLGQCGFFLRVILQDRVHSEVERVFPDSVILNRRVKGRFQRPFPVVDGLVGIALLAHPDGPFLGVRELHRVNASGAQGSLFRTDIRYSRPFSVLRLTFFRWLFCRA